jgi:hypothetical protein
MKLLMRYPTMNLLSARRLLTLAGLLLAAGLFTMVATPRASAVHVAGHQCGVQSSSFARTCRPGAHATCLRAVARGVKGFTKGLCDKRQAACSKCLGDIRTCISRIGHWPKLTHTCEKCRKRFDACYDSRYPKG